MCATAKCMCFIVWNIWNSSRYVVLAVWNALNIEEQVATLANIMYQIAQAADNTHSYHQFDGDSPHSSKL